jgi:hypothetical protein
MDGETCTRHGEPWRLSPGASRGRSLSETSSAFGNVMRSIQCLQQKED